MNGTRRLLQYQPRTVPIERAEKFPAAPLTPDSTCGWCGIKLAAVPDTPVLVGWEYFHPSGCLQAAWRRQAITTDYPVFIPLSS